MVFVCCLSGVFPSQIFISCDWSTGVMPVILTNQNQAVNATSTWSQAGTRFSCTSGPSELRVFPPPLFLYMYSQKKSGVSFLKPQLDGWMGLFQSFLHSCVEILVGWLDRPEKNGVCFLKTPVGWLDGSVPVLPRLLCGYHGWMVG